MIGMPGKFALFAPALALAGWAIAAAAGVSPDVLRVTGPAVTALASAMHIVEELHMFRVGHGR